MKTLISPIFVKRKLDVIIFVLFLGTWSSRSQCQRRNVLPIFGLKKGLRSFKKETSGKWQINFDDEHTQTINLSYKKKEEIKKLLRRACKNKYNTFSYMKKQNTNSRLREKKITDETEEKMCLTPQPIIKFLLQTFDFSHHTASFRFY